MAAVIWVAVACFGVVGSPRAHVGLARRAARAPSARPAMDGGGFELARREVLNGLASSMVLGDFFGRLPFFRRDAPARGRATTARIPDVPEYYSSLPPFQRRITPEGLVLRSVPTTCPPVNALTQDVLRLDVIRQLPPATCETLAGNEPFWVGFERGIATVRETLANSPPLLRLFVSDDLARPTDRAVGEVRATLDSLSLAAKARNVASSTTAPARDPALAASAGWLLRRSSWWPFGRKLLEAAHKNTHARHTLSPSARKQLDAFYQPHISAFGEILSRHARAFGGHLLVLPKDALAPARVAKGSGASPFDIGRALLS